VAALRFLHTCPLRICGSSAPRSSLTESHKLVLWGLVSLHKLTLDARCPHCRRAWGYTLKRWVRWAHKER
jgi:hypothetical protein